MTEGCRGPALSPSAPVSVGCLVRCSVQQEGPRPWLQVAGSPEQAQRPSKVSFCGGRSKGPETRKRKHLPQGRWLLGIRFRLSSRKWASGARESGPNGEQSRFTSRACLHVGYLRLKEPPFLKVVLILIMIISKCICMRGSSYLYK